ncbi:hypothetical protein ACJIZ3_001023 [Penstemon smallii]|uniref:AAA+ ATPase domain-containing protein n=1 Tax=Penstemon smallii TaxID=265156 RepID=A0ABD3U2U4_9LAMI
MSGGGGGGGIVAAGAGGIDPSNLHLKKEITQIRKAARVLRDPGTSSTWRSPTPINSARSITKHHYVHHHKNVKNDGNAIASSSAEQFLQLPLQVESNSNIKYINGNAANDKGNVNMKEKEKKVFLYNWRSQKSESESRDIGEEECSMTQDKSVDADSLSDARNGGRNIPKIDNYSSDGYASAIFNCKDANFTPSIRRSKKKPRRSNYSSASLKKQMVLSTLPKRVVHGSPRLDLRRDDLVSLVDQSDDTEIYCNSEDLRRASGLSPLLARFKNKRWSKSPRNLLRSYRKEYDSVSRSTPALSTSSYNKYGVRNLRNPSTVESWDASTSLNESDDEVYDQSGLPGQGCGIPCYWSKRSTPKSSLKYGSCSPSLSETLRRKGSGILCGSQTMYRKRRPNSSRTAAQSRVPLLTNNGGGRGGSSSVGSGNSGDELSTNFGELDLEALSRLDGKRWSTSCRSQDSSPENVRSSLSHKYRSMFFEELIGQNRVVQSLTTAVSKGRIAPVYLFQGPRGSGKTSTARIFGAALNCLATEESKPCGVCRVCADFVSGKTRYLIEVDGSNKKGISKIKNLLKNLSVVSPSVPQEYKVFVIEECHLLPTKTWLTFLRLLEKSLPRVVFILITTDIDNVPYTILSRCQKQLFKKISNGDIVTRLRKIVSDENFDVELDALELIATNADGSLRDAETMLDQLSLFGKRITVALVKELIGVVSDEKVLELLELAMSSNATETVIRARELMASGVDPTVLMSQMATLIVDIIAGTYPSADDAKHNYYFFSGRSLSERELDRLKHALALLSEAEKHLRVSSERSTWFTATLLQLGSVPSPNRTHSGSSHRQSYRATEEDNTSITREATMMKQRIDAQFGAEKSGSPETSMIAAHRNSTSKINSIEATSIDSSPNQSHSKMLHNIWLQCIEKCHSKTLRQLLQFHGKLLSISEMQGGFVAHIAFTDGNIKTRAEGFLSSITNSFEIVLRRNVEVKIIQPPDQNPTDKNTAMNQENKSSPSIISHDLGQESLRVSKGSFDVSEDHQTEHENKSNIPVQRIEAIIREQRLETAWLQAMEKGTPGGSMSRLKPERNQVLPQDGVYNNNNNYTNELESMNSVEDDLNHEMKALRINDGIAPQTDEIIRRNDHCPISPMHNNSKFTSNLSKENIGYESGSGGGCCSSMFCWNKTKQQRKGKVKQGAHIRARKRGGLSLFGDSSKAKKTETRYSR